MREIRVRDVTEMRVGDQRDERDESERNERD